MWSRLKNIRFIRHEPPKAPIYIFCHHKCGTQLILKSFRRICSEFKWRFQTLNRFCKTIPDDADVVLFINSQVNLKSASVPYVGAHFIRDPRDVIVSGYLYHKRCAEKWCVNTDFDLTEPILHPKVPNSQEHRTEDWKKAYLSSLNKKSYQQNLLDRTETEGILFEMNHYGAWTIESMLNWNYENPAIMEVRFETLINNFDETFRNIFERFKMSDRQITHALKIASKEDINKMSEKKIKANDHISSKQITKWKKYFKEIHKNAFLKLFDDALIRLGYEESDDW